MESIVTTITFKDLLHRKNQFILGFWILVFLVIRSLPSDLLQFSNGLFGYLPFHTLMEVFSIIVSMLVFTIEWEGRTDNKYLNTSIVASIFFAVGIIDFFHFLSFPGMPSFVTESSANKSIFFWLCGRISIAIALMYLSISPPKSNNRSKYIPIVAAIFFVVFIAWLGLFHLDYFPDMFIEGTGLTSFKIFSETFVIAILLMSLLIFFFRFENLANHYDLENIFMAICLMIMSEMFFMVFTAHTDLYNFSGHLYKVISYYYFYRALFRVNFLKPYNELDLKNKELVTAKMIAESANQEKIQFIANLSHEIRTPMNSIIAMSELLSESNQDQDQKKYTQVIQHAAEHLMSLINSTLDLSRIESGKMELQNELFNISDMLNRTKELCLPLANKKNISVNFYRSSDVPTKVIGDLNKLSRIILNLVNNAIKFTEKGNVELSVSLKSKQLNKVVILFKVKDTGIGIPVEQIHLLFKNFSQLNNNSSEKNGGSGLGLAISKKLIHLMNGDISVESTVNKGSTFSFYVTLESAD